MNYDLVLKGDVGDWDFDPEYVDYVLTKKQDQPVVVKINSPGGTLGAALSVAASFRQHGDVTVHLVGVCASAATVASLGARKISIDRGALYMIHKGQITIHEWQSMNADQISTLCEKLKKKKGDLTKIDGLVAALYATRCKKKADQLLEMMSDETWMTPEEALAGGFVDEIIGLETVTPSVDDVTARYLADNNTPLPSGYGHSQTKLDTAIEKLINLFSTKSKKMEKIETSCQDQNQSGVAGTSSSGPVIMSADEMTAEISRLRAENDSLRSERAGNTGVSSRQVVENSSALSVKNDFSEALKLFNSLP